MKVIEPDADSPTGYSWVVKDEITSEEYSREQNALPPRGYIPRETTTTDPFGQKTTSVSTPIMPGKNKQDNGKGAGPDKPDVKTPKKPGEQIKDLKSKTGQGQAKQVDKDGHIPTDVKANPLLKEAADNLLDGMAVKDLQVPEKDKAAAQALAREYGWAGQGMFTPRDKLLVRESTAILNQLSSSDSLSVLDDAGSRQKLLQVLQNPDKRGPFGQAIQTGVAGSLTEPEQQFVTLYNQAVGRIAGLSQLVRSGRATEAQIERLKQELPNPATTASSEHARQKLKQIQSEIDIALQKGQFSAAGGDAEVDDIVNALKGK